MTIVLPHIVRTVIPERAAGRKMVRSMQGVRVEMTVYWRKLLAGVLLG